MNEQPQGDQPTPEASSTQEEIKPVAYDSTGRPLYAAPPPPGYVEQNVPQVVHLSRAVVPDEPIITPEVKQRHDESTKIYPDLNLSEAEYIVSDVPRHPLGMAGTLVLTVILLAVIATVLLNLGPVVDSFGLDSSMMAPIVLGGILLAAVCLIGGYIGIWVFLHNRFFLTNESVIQNIQWGLFSHREQTVSLGSVEDASYRQRGILPLMFNYGSIRLSTTGDETTYRLNYVRNPKDQIAILNNAVEAFKNGRPVETK